MRKRIIFVGFALILFAVPVWAGNDVSWEPSNVVETVLIGTTDLVQVSFTSSVQLSNVNVRVVPELSGFVSGIPASFQSIVPGQLNSLILLFNVPAGTPAASLDGTVHLVGVDTTSRTFDVPLKVQLVLKQATLAEIPSTIALPSLDRIVTETGLTGALFVKDELDITFRDGVPSTAISNSVAQIGGVFLGSIAEINYYQVQVPAQGFDALSVLINELKQDANVVSARYHVFLSSSLAPNDPGTQGSYVPDLIDLPKAWDLTTGSKTLSNQNSQTLGIAIIDTVFDNGNLDFKDNVLKPANNSAPAITNDHGTRVASIVAAKGNNGLGIAGVMWNASLRLYSALYSYSLSCLFPGPLPICDALKGKLDPTLLQKALAEATSDQPFILNLSAGFGCAANPCTQKEITLLKAEDDTFIPLIQANPNILWVFSAGNNGIDSSGQSPARLSSPDWDQCCYQRVMNVSAVSSGRTLGQFGGGFSSNYGKDVSVAAPGVAVPSDQAVLLDLVVNYDQSFNGTSASAPFVTGVAGLMLSVNPNLTAAQLKTIIHDTATHTSNFDPGGNEILLLDAFRAVQQAQALLSKKEFAFVANGTGTSDNVWSYSVDKVTGALTPVINPSTGSPGFSTPGAAPGSLSVAADPVSNFVYVANLGVPISNGNVSGYRFDAVTGVLTPVNGSPFSAGVGPVSVAIDPKGKFVYVGNEISGDIAAYTIDSTTGTLTSIPGSPFFSLSVDRLGVDPLGRFLFGLGADVKVFRIDPTTGGLSLTSSSPAGFGPISVAVDPTGKFVYVANISGNVSAYTLDSATGALAPIAGSPFPGTLSAFSVTVDPSGKFVYVANANPSNSVSAYTINPNTGALTPIVGSPFPVGFAATSVAVDPSGRFVYVTTNGVASNIFAYTLDPSTGALTPLVGSPFPGGVEPLSITISGKTP